MIVVDSTVIAALGVETPWSSEAARLLKDDDPLIAPQAALLRAWEALRQLQSEGHISRETYQRLASLLPAALAGIAADQQLMTAATDLAMEFDLAPEPAMCLALAQARKARLATADRSLAETARNILSPERVILLSWGKEEASGRKAASQSADSPDSKAKTKKDKAAERERMAG